MKNDKTQNKNQPQVHEAIPSSAAENKRTTNLLLAALFAVAALAGVYYWQHQQVVSANKTISGLNDQVRSLRVALADLETKSKTAPIPSPTTVPSPTPATRTETQSDLKITVSGTTYNDHPYCQAVKDSPAYAAINIKLTNPTNSPIFLTAASIKLKDGDDNVYLAIKDANPNTSCHGGYTLLADQSIAPGETVKGALIYQVPNSSMHNFELVNESKAYSVTVQ